MNIHKAEDKKGFEEENVNWENINSQSQNVSKIQEFKESKVLLNPPSIHQEFIKVAPRINKKKFKKMNILRIQKIRQIISDEYPMQGIKLFDLHLLNMKR